MCVLTLFSVCVDDRLGAEEVKGQVPETCFNKFGCPYNLS